MDKGNLSTYIVPEPPSVYLTQDSPSLMWANQQSPSKDCCLSPTRHSPTNAAGPRKGTKPRFKRFSGTERETRLDSYSMKCSRHVSGAIDNRVWSARRGICLRTSITTLSYTHYTCHECHFGSDYKCVGVYSFLCRTSTSVTIVLYSTCSL